MEELLSGGLMLIICSVWIAIPVALFLFLRKRADAADKALKIELQQLVQSLPKESQSAFMVQYGNKEKSVNVALLLALFFGGIGLHKFYLHEAVLGIVYLIFCWTTIPLWVALVEAFLMPEKVKKYNLAQARESAAMLGGSIKAFQ